jgi:hypothetical protein
MAAFEARVLRVTLRKDGDKGAADEALQGAQMADVFCNVRSLVSFGAASLLLVAVVATALALGALLIHQRAQQLA